MGREGSCNKNVDTEIQVFIFPCPSHLTGKRSSSPPEYSGCSVLQHGRRVPVVSGALTSQECLTVARRVRRRVGVKFTTAATQV